MRHGTGYIINYMCTVCLKKKTSMTLLIETFDFLFNDPVFLIINFLNFLLRFNERFSLTYLKYENDYYTRRGVGFVGTHQN